MPKSTFAATSPFTGTVHTRSTNREYAFAVIHHTTAEVMRARYLRSAQDHEENRARYAAIASGAAPLDPDYPRLTREHYAGFATDCAGCASKQRERAANATAVEEASFHSTFDLAAKTAAASHRERTAVVACALVPRKTRRTNPNTEEK